MEIDKCSNAKNANVGKWTGPVSKVWFETAPVSHLHKHVTNPDNLRAGAFYFIIFTSHRFLFTTYFAVLSNVP